MCFFHRKLFRFLLTIYWKTMSSKDIIYELQLQLYEVFKAQNPESFDVVFEVEGKKIYADKFRLSGLSSTFNSMLSDRWTSKNDAIKIECYTFDDFYEFLTFLYSGKCSLKDENIFGMLDIAEFYQVNSLKKLCDKYLSKMEYKMDNVFQLLEISSKYSLILMKKPLHGFVSENFASFRKSDGFLNAEKIKQILAFKIDIQPEEIYQAVYEWAERQAINKQNESNNENFNMNDAIRAEMFPFLPYIEFKKMGYYFLHEHVVNKSFLFTSDDLNDLLIFAYSLPKVKVTNSEGQSIYGSLPPGNDAINAIKSLKNCYSDNSEGSCIWWRTNFTVPLTPRPLKKRDGVKYYLILDDYEYGDICVVNSGSLDKKDYLLAEMYSETDFRFTRKSKIEIE